MHDEEIEIERPEDAEIVLQGWHCEGLTKHVHASMARLLSLPGIEGHDGRLCLRRVPDGVKVLYRFEGGEGHGAG